MLMGFGYLGIPPKNWELISHHAPYRPYIGLPMRLTTDDILWVGALGRFKTHLAQMRESEPPPRVSFTGCASH